MLCLCLRDFQRFYCQAYTKHKTLNITLNVRNQKMNLMWRQYITGSGLGGNLWLQYLPVILKRRKISNIRFNDSVIAFGDGKYIVTFVHHRTEKEIRRAVNTSVTNMAQHTVQQ